jgi:hypothetical protein
LWKLLQKERKESMVLMTDEDFEGDFLEVHWIIALTLANPLIEKYCLLTSDPIVF